MPDPIAPRNPNANADAWRRFDRETRVTTDGGVRTVDHGASIKPNLEAAGKELGHIFTPDHFEAAENARDGSLMDKVRIGYAAVREVTDVVTEPVKAIKNVADAATHSVIGLKNTVVKIFG
jgi:hypothetical protein